MKEKVFVSTLSMEEIESNFQSIDFFSELHESLAEASDVATGKKRAKLSHRASLPDVNVTVVRKRLNMTQKLFANTLGVSVRTVEAWEAGRTNPTPTAKKLMHIISKYPQMVEEL